VLVLVEGGFARADYLLRSITKWVPCIKRVPWQHNGRTEFPEGRKKRGLRNDLHYAKARILFTVGQVRSPPVTAFRSAD
jgi:hypothetical protein